MACEQSSRLILLFFICISTFTTIAWARYSSMEIWPLSRRSFCGRQRESCYSTDQCCKPFVCATFDEMGTNPEIPGLCMREKDLKPCDDDADCRVTERCARLDGVISLYCVPRPPARLHSHTKVSPTSNAGLGGLGSSCVTSSDCNKFTENGEDPLCCQKVQLGRQGSKVICDRQTIRSTCIIGDL